MEEAYVDTITRYSQEASLWFGEDQKLSPGLMLLTFITTHVFQFHFATTERYCLFTLTCLKRNWDQKLSSGVLLTFMTTHLFLFRFADTEQYWVILRLCVHCRL